MISAGKAAQLRPMLQDVRHDAKEFLDAATSRSGLMEAAISRAVLQQRQRRGHLVLLPGQKLVTRS